MLYTCTRDKSVRVTASKAIADGISPDGGLYLPSEIPALSKKDFAELSTLSYKERAFRVLSLYLTDFSAEELSSCIDGAYRAGKFTSDKIAPVVHYGGNEYILELFGGPTCAFKDVALQILPYLLTVSASKNIEDKEIVILVATSGDTGKAALEGFKNVPGTKILVFYPSDGVSMMQKLQMATQEGANVGVAAIRGNFDDAQNGVKAIFTDKAILKKFEDNNLAFSSANSINWGRLVPQIVYYVSAYCELLASGAIKDGESINITVPTGNFGNILAAYYAMRMGVPVKKLICASNKNRVLTDFLKTGVYDRKREFYATSSPSMDILISSNLERLLFLLTDGDDARVRDWFSRLKSEGVYEVGDDVKQKLSALFAAGSCDDEGTKKQIKDSFENHNYLADTHTAVGLRVCGEYLSESGDTAVTLIAATANAYKFPAAVLEALGGKTEGLDEFDMIGKLELLTGVKAPAQLLALKSKPVRFSGVTEKENMADAVFSMLGI